MSLAFVTSNENKLASAEEILGSNLERKEIELEEIQSIDTERVAEMKAKDAFKALNTALIVTDVGLSIKELNGFPGALIKHYFKRLGKDKISQIAGGSKATATTTIGYHDGNKVKIFSGSVHGEITKEPRGKNGFGWDPIFSPENSSRTFAEMKSEEKRNYSMRREALEKLKNNTEM